MKLEAEDISEDLGLKCCLLGTPMFLLDGREITVRFKKVLGLIAYLALEGTTSRLNLVGLLWSDLDESSARRNLRRELHRLGTKNPELHGKIVTEGDFLRLAEPFSSDVQTFEQALKHDDLEMALRVYRGELLLGFDLVETPDFQEWLVLKREYFANLHRKTRLEFAERLETRGAWQEALELHLKLLEEDELQERQHREVMRLYYLLGMREAALKQFERCCWLLKNELGLEPLSETLELVASIRAVQTLSPALQRPAINVSTVLPRASRLVGREQAWAQMEAAWQEKKLILLVGEAGIGKTRLMLEFAASKGAFELTGGRPGDAITPFATVTRTIENLLEHYPSVVLPNWVRRELARLVPKLTDEPSTAIVSLEERGRFFTAFAELVQQIAQNIATLLCDDMQFFDASSLEMAFAATQRFVQLADKRCIAAFRRFDLTPEVNAMLETYVQNGQAVLIEIEPLAETDFLEMVEDFSTSRSSLLFGQRLHKSSGGNPFFALEMMRSLIETSNQQHLKTLFDQNTELPIPQNVRELILRRIKKLDSATRRLLEAACLTTDGFDLETLRGATALSEWEGLEALEDAISTRLLERFGEGYRFTHDLMRSILEENLSLERQKLLHRKLAISLEKQTSASAQIAHHLEQAGQSQQAIVWRIKAAREAVIVYANQDALLQYAKAQNNGATGQALFAIYLEQQKVLMTLGLEHQRKQSLEAMKDLAKILEDIQLQVISQLHFAQYFNQTRQHQHAIDSINQLLETHPLALKEQAWAWLERGIGAFRLGELISGKTDLLKALEYQSLLEPQTLAEIHSYLRVIALYEGDLEGAEHHVELELAVAEKFSSLSGKLGAKTGSARIAMIRGDVLGAVQTLTDSLELAEKIGSTSEQIYARMWLAYNQIQLGKLEQANDNITKAFILANQSKDTLSRVRLLLLKARVYSLTGQLGQAVQHARQALEESQAVSVAAEIIALQCLATILLEIGDVQNAKQFYTQGLQLAASSNFRAYLCPLEIGLVHCSLATLVLETAELHLQQATESQALAEAHEKDDVLFARATMFLALGQAAKARTALEPLRTTILPEHQLRFWTLELQSSAALKLLPDLQAVFEILKHSSSSQNNLELRRSLLRMLQKLQAKQHLELQKNTQTIALEMVQSLAEFPTLKTLFSQKNADLF